MLRPHNARTAAPNPRGQQRLSLLVVAASAACAFCGWPSASGAAPTPSTNASTRRTHRVTPEDYFTIGALIDARVSPDGRAIVYAEMRWESGRETRNTDLWRVDLQTKRRQRLTFGPEGDYAPRWSVDGRQIYFISARKNAAKKPPHNGKPQIWRIRADGSRLVPITREEDGVASFQLGASGRYLYYVVNKKTHTKGPFSALRKRFGKLIYGHGVYRPSRLVRLDLQEWRTRDLLTSKRVIRELQVSDDETKAALLTTPDNRLISNEGWSRIEVLYFDNGKTVLPDTTLWRKKAPSPYGWLGEPRWSSDGSLLAFRIDFDGYPGRIYVLPMRGRTFLRPIQLARKKEETIGDGLEWIPRRHTLCYQAIDRAVDRVYCARIDGAKQRPTEILTAGPGSVDGFTFAPDGSRVALMLSGLTHPTDLFVAPTTPNQTSYQRVTTLNPQIDSWKLPSISRVSWKSKDGTTVEGILELPPDHKAGTRLPLLVEIHGGPTSATRYRFRFWIYGRTLFSGNGWAVLSPNYRGSTGYGDKFLTDLIGKKNVRDVEDILSGVDHLVAKGLVDPKRMAIMGWSNGG
ncbi:MAG: S9 family peptidase, partial [Myxococcales bacterium]|nr:S9 family peptidase [Myxococcales bacterium]